MNHLSPLSLFLFVFVSGRRLRSDRSVQMLPSPHFLPLASLCLRPCHYLIYTPPFIAIPRSKGRKRHFSAAEAVISCCQSPLYCRSCICSSLLLSTEHMGAAGASTGTIMLPHKPEKLPFSYTWISVFLKPKVRIGWMNIFILSGNLKDLCKCSAPPCIQIHIHANMICRTYSLCTILATVLFVFVWLWFLFV